MSLDQNLFTLVFTPNKDHPNVTDLIDPSGTVHYHKRRVAGAEYKIEVFGAFYDLLLHSPFIIQPSSFDLTSTGLNVLRREMLILV
jgi:hypothetical protein